MVYEHSYTIKRYTVTASRVKSINLKRIFNSFDHTLVLVGNIIYFICLIESFKIPENSIIGPPRNAETLENTLLNIPDDVIPHLKVS